jgi:hypothetical protein
MAAEASERPFSGRAFSVQPPFMLPVPASVRHPEFSGGKIGGIVAKHVIYPAAFLALSAACSTGAVCAERSYSISGVTAVAITGVNATIAIGPKASVVLRGDQRDLNRVEVAVENGELRLKPYNSSVFNWKSELLENITVQITVRALREVSIAGAGNVTASGITGKHFEVYLGGGGTFTGQDVDVRNVELGIAGSGTITLSGACDRADIGIGGSGKIQASALKCKSTHVSLTGGGAVETYASVSATTVIAGGGSVAVFGNPAKRDGSASRGGTVAYPDN